MIDLDGEIEGPITATRDTALWGTVSGDVVVKAGVLGSNSTERSWAT